MNTPTSAVVPSREAVEAMIYAKGLDHGDGQAEEMVRAIYAEVERWESRCRIATSIVDTLKAEVERLTSVLEIVEADRAATYRSRETLRATVADQAAALAERDKDAERYRWLRHGDNDDEVIRYTSRHTANAYVLREEKLDIAIDAALAASVSSASEEGGT